MSRDHHIFILLAIMVVVCLSGAGCTTGNLQNSPSLPSGGSPAPAVHGNSPVSSVEYQDIRGTWKADDGEGYYMNSTIQHVDIGENTWVFTSQHGHIVEGYKIFQQPDGTMANQTLAGMFDPDGRSIYFIDQPGGWAKGTLTNPDTIFITLTYSSGRDTMGNAMALTMTLHRQK